MQLIPARRIYSVIKAEEGAHKNCHAGIHFILLNELEKVQACKVSPELSLHVQPLSPKPGISGREA
jgi:hypothetical protein